MLYAPGKVRKLGKEGSLIENKQEAKGERDIIFELLKRTL